MLSQSLDKKKTLFRPAEKRGEQPEVTFQSNRNARCAEYGKFRRPNETFENLEDDNLADVKSLHLQIIPYTLSRSCSRRHTLRWTDVFGFRELKIACEMEIRVR